MLWSKWQILLGKYKFPIGPICCCGISRGLAGRDFRHFSWETKWVDLLSCPSPGRLEDSVSDLTPHTLITDHICSSQSVGHDSSLSITYTLQWQTFNLLTNWQIIGQWKMGESHLPFDHFYFLSNFNNLEADLCSRGACFRSIIRTSEGVPVVGAN